MINPTKFKIIPPLETYPKLVDFSQKIPGKILLLVIFSAGLSCHFDNWVQLSGFISAMTFLPQIRPILLTTATFGALYMADWPNAEIHWAIPQLHYSLNSLLKVLMPAGVLGLFAVYYTVVKKNKDEWYGKRPVRNLLIFYILILITATTVPLSSPQSIYLWGFIVILGKYLWFFNYTLLDRHAKETPRLALQAGYYIPFWGGTATPFPKGAAYLRKIEAKTSEQLAISQLKGVKLLYWALLLLPRPVRRRYDQRSCQAKPRTNGTWLNLFLAFVLPSSGQSNSKIREILLKLILTLLIPQSSCQLAPLRFSGVENENITSLPLSFQSLGISISPIKVTIQILF